MTHPDLSRPPEQLLKVWAVGPAIILASIAVSVRGYRHYEIDRIISRANAFTVMVGVLAATFSATVTVAQRLLLALFGPEALGGPALGCQLFLASGGSPRR